MLKTVLVVKNLEIIYVRINYGKRGIGIQAAFYLAFHGSITGKTGQRIGGEGFPGAPQEAIHARNYLKGFERLVQVFVCAQFYPGNAVLHFR